MRTRTLLLLAVACGLAILLAGGIQLLRIAGQDERPAPLGIGDTGGAGDAVVTVLSYDEDAQFGVVEVKLSGVDDPDGLTGFGLVAPGQEASIAPDPAVSTCDGFTVAEQTCTLAFATADLDASDRQLVFLRAEESVRWVLVS